MEKDNVKVPDLAAAEHSIQNQNTIQKNISRLPKIIILVLVLIIIGLSFYIALRGSSNSQQKNTSVSETVTLTPIEIPTPTLEVFDGPLPAIPPSFETAPFVKRQVNITEKFFYTYDYPEEVKIVPDSQLVGMKCSPWVTLESVDSEEAFYRALKYKLLQAAGDHSWRFTYCKTEDGKEYIEYDDASEAHFGSMNPDGSIRDIAQMEAVFEACGSPIQLEKNGQMVFVCSGGDTREHKSIFRLNTLNGTLKGILFCATDFPGPDPKPPKCSPPTP